ncbi:hypothetical protein KCP77_03250 [Salmonella enterica subsp. enterica]|nr:hypothetical protein KCP77_03250 [Salmonella enterica subsp. enterica]
MAVITSRTIQLPKCVRDRLAPTCRAAAHVAHLLPSFHGGLTDDHTDAVIPR